MVHKRYVKRGGKLYGPYFYESFRDKNGKVRNTYLGSKTSEKAKRTHAKATLAVMLLVLGIFFAFAVFNALEITGLTTKQSGTTNLTILDDTEKESIYYRSNRSSNPSMIPFTANYTETEAGASITGNCTIAFNIIGTFTDPFQMSYNQTGFEGSYRYNYSFDRRGTFQFNISCNSTSYATLSVVDYFNVLNTPPVIPAYDLPGPGVLPAQTCAEDTACTYNFSLNVTEYDLNDIPITNYTISNRFSCISINSTTGMATVNCTEDSAAGSFTGTAAPKLTATDGAGDSVELRQDWTVSIANDAPEFNTTNWNVTATEDVFFSYDINAWDEENGSYPNLHYRINASYTWLNSTSINSTTGNISFLASNSEIGFYHVNVTVNDSTGLTTSHDLQINVVNINDAPNLTIACSPNLTMTTTEDQYFECYVNATDPDPDEALTFTANYTWLALNSSSITVEGGKAGILWNLTPTDSSVGHWWVKFTVTDGELSDTETLNLTILNVEEYPFFTNIANFSVYANVPFRYDVNASDNDSSSQQGDTITFTDNTTLFNINSATGVIDFTPTNASAGTNWVNITVTDSTDRSASYVINFTINPNTAPRLSVEGNYSITEGINYYTNLSLNFTDTEGDSFNFTDNSTLFNIQAYGNLTINATEDDIGTHWVIVNATDIWGAVGTYTLNFTIYNVNEVPILFNITGLNTTEGAAIAFNISANDSDLLNSRNNENLTFRFNYTWIESTKANATTARVAFTVPTSLLTLAGEYSVNYWVNATVSDTGGNEASYVFYVNITNSADYPKFTYMCNNELTQTEDVNVLCRINATDLDAGAQLNFTANYTWFLLNGSRITVDESSIASSLVNFTPTYLQVGNWSINVSVSDGVYINTTILHMNISSVNDQPNITTRDVVTGFTIHNISYDVNATDEEDGNDGYGGDGITSNLTFATNDSRFAINSKGTLTFSPNATQNGTYWVNVTVNDTQGYGFSYVLNVTVRSNNAPTCSVFLRGGVPTTPPGSFTMNENASTGQFVSSCTDTEGDTIYYNWFWYGTLNTSSTTATGWNYTTSFSDAGDKNITLIVTDLTYNSTYYWNVTVNNTNMPPQMYKNIPNITAGWFQNSDRSIILTDYFYDPDNDTLTYDWYYYGINESFETLDPQWSVIQGTWNVSNNITNYFYNQSMSNGETIVAYDNSYKNITSLEVKIRAYNNKTAGICFRAQGNSCSESYKVYFNGSTSSLIWEVQEGGAASSSNSSVGVTVAANAWNWIKVLAEGPNITVYYSNNSLNYTLAYFISNGTGYTNGKIILFTQDTRADFDDIVLKTPDTANFTISQNANNLTFSPRTDFYGDQQLRITASDGNTTTESNIFYLTIFYATPGVETVTTTQMSAGGTTTQSISASLEIIVPSMITLNALTTTLVPVVLNNTGEVPLNLIDLVASTNQSLITLKLDKTNWPMLGVGEKVNAMLEVTAGLLAPERYVIELAGTSKSPRVRQTAKINVDVREREAALKVQLKENIAFTRDLFLQNPECLELTEMLDKADALYEEGKYQEGLDLVKTANEGCKNFMAQERKVEKIVAAKRFLQENWKMIVAELIGTVLFVLLMIYYLRRRRFGKTPKFE